MEVVRMFLVLGHLFALLAAAVAVAFGDYALLGGKQIDNGVLRKASSGVALALAALWVTGLGIIYVDTHFAMALILAKPKILAKLTVVGVLTLNGMFMHAKVLPSLERRFSAERAVGVAAWATVAGAVSAAGWGYAVFLGVARPLTPILGYQGFIALFVLAVLGACVVSARLVRPALARRLIDASPQAVGVRRPADASYGPMAQAA